MNGYNYDFSASNNEDSDYSETALRFQPVCLIDSDRLDSEM
jgi:hypothetical protein